MAVGNFVYRTNRANFSALPPPNSTAGCPASWLEDDQLTSSLQEPLTYLESGHLDLYDVSSIWYSAIGVAFVLILALLSSCILPSKKSESVDKELLSPLIIPFLPSSSASSFTSTSSSSFFCCTSTPSSPSSPFLPSLYIGTKSTNPFLSKSKMLSSTTNIKEGENEESAKKEELEEMVERNVNKVEFV